LFFTGAAAGATAGATVGEEEKGSFPVPSLFLARADAAAQEAVKEDTAAGLFPDESYVTNLFRRAAPSVVHIRTRCAQSLAPLLALTHPLSSAVARFPFSQDLLEIPQGAGSGFIIDPAGFIVTNNHVVGAADTIIVSLADGTELPAKLVGADELTDIAVIKVTQTRPLPFVSWGDSRTIEVGDWVIAAGNPFGLGGSVTAGILSARGRDIGASPFDDFLQIDAPINPGNSGGPVFNADGQVVGVNTAIVSPNGGGSVGIGFAVPSEIAMKIAAELREKGRIDRGWLGVSLLDAPMGDPARRRLTGVTIGGIDRLGPAAKAGLRAEDLLTAVNGQPVDSAKGVIKAVGDTPPGKIVTLTVRRQGRDIDIPVTVGRRPANDQG
jgi:serine protease Do